MEHIRGLDPRPDVVLVTGDLVDAGRDDEYGRLRELLTPLPGPAFLIPAITTSATPCAQVEAVLCGHLHRPIQCRWADTIAMTAPSPAHQVALDLRQDDPGLGFTMEPPAILLHLWRPGPGLVSHTSYVGAFDGPHPFREGGQLIE